MSCFNKASYGKCVIMRAVLSCTTCTSVPMGLFSGMSQSRLPAVHGRVHSFSISQRPQGPWILFSISPWWKSKSIHLIFERACAISVIEWEQHFQAAVVSAFAYSADCIWPPLQSSYLWAEEAAVCYHVLHLSFCTRFRWEGFICIVSLGSVDFGKGWLQGGGNAGKQHSCDGLVFSHTSLFLRLGSQPAGCGGHREIVDDTMPLWKLELVLSGLTGRFQDFWGNCLTKAHGRQGYLPWLHPLHLPPLQLPLFFSTEPHKGNRMQVKSALVSVSAGCRTPVNPQAWLYHPCRVWGLRSSIVREGWSRGGFFLKQLRHLCWKQAIRNWSILL